MKSGKWFQELYDSVKDNPEFITEGIMIEIGEVICTRMKELGLSQQDLAKSLNKKQPFISRILKDGSNTTIKTLVTITHALHLSIDITLKDKKRVVDNILEPVIEVTFYREESENGLNEQVIAFSTTTLRKKSAKTDSIEYAA